MSEFAAAEGRIARAYQQYRLGIAVIGTVAIVTGLVILFWPSMVVGVLVNIIGAYAIIAGAVYLGIGIFSKSLTSSAKVGRIILGAVLIILGIVALNYSTTTGTIVFWVIAIAVGAAWITEGVLTLVAVFQNEPLNGPFLAYGIFAIVAGIAILLSPFYGDSVSLLRWLFGVSFVVLGAAQIARAITVGKKGAKVVEVATVVEEAIQ